MSKGPGRIERSLRELFANNPTEAFTTDDLVTIAFPGANRIEKKHRVSVLRAARRIVDTDPNWEMFAAWSARGRLRVFFNADDLKSYVLARLMAIYAITRSRDSRTTFTRTRECMRAELDGEAKHHLTGPNGAWFKDVMLHRARRDGQVEYADKLAAERNAEFQLFVKQTRLVLTKLFPQRRRRHIQTASAQEGGR